MSVPLVSVIIPSYNHSQYIGECVKSIICQTYQHIELIIIDDGSTDGSIEAILELVPECESRFVRFEFRHRNNRGLTDTLNEGLRWVNGTFLSPIASDDMFLPNKIEKQVRLLLERPNAVVVSAGCVLVDRHGAKIREIQMRPKRLYFDAIFLRRASIVAPSVMFRTQKLIDVGGWPKELKVEDYYMWLKLTEEDNYYIYDSGEILCKYRRHEDNYSRSYDALLNERLLIIRQYNSRPAYKHAKQMNYLIAASHSAAYSKCDSLKYIRKSGFPSSRWALWLLFKVCAKLVLNRSSLVA